MKALITAPAGTVLTAIAEGKEDSLITPDASKMQFEHDELVVSDGYHTFDELYDHRITLFIALCRHMHELLGMENPGKFKVWRSKLHSDGSSFDGWFILGIGTEKGKQITYHLPMDRWEETDLFTETHDKAPEWDGHTAADVIERLKAL